MKLTTTGGGLLAAALLATAMLPSVAGAKAPVLKLKTAKGELTTGSEVVAESSDLIFETSAGNLECTSNILKGKLSKNNSKKDEGAIESETSTGGEPGGLCKTTTPLGPTEIKTSNLPWSTDLTTKGIDEVKGKKVSFTPSSPTRATRNARSKPRRSRAPSRSAGRWSSHDKQKFKSTRRRARRVPEGRHPHRHLQGTSGGETVESELA